MTAGLMTGCSADSESGIDLDRVGEQVQQGIDDARGTIEGVEEQIRSAGLDETTRATVEDAVSSASSAMDQARAALESAAATAGPEADAAVQDAKQSLADARAKLDDATAQTEGVVKTGLETLAEQIDGLAARLGDA